MVSSEPELSEAEELDALTRTYSGLVDQLRIEALGRRLRRTNGLAIAESNRGFFGDRLTMTLDGGDILRLRLFWPLRDRAVAALVAIFWNDEVGWVVDLRTTSGEPVRLYAWRAWLRHPRVVADSVS